MIPDPSQAKAIFLEAVGKHAPQDWDTYLSKVCGDDAELRRQVMILLDAHQQAGSFLDAPAVARTIDMPADLPFAERPGTQIGQYKLLEQIGEGGFGVVFLAEQAQPVRRKVALKVLKPGMDTRQVIARFEAERQALAIMDHPNIAKVFDGGATPSGRPYFVMELVKGIPITEFCDQSHLTPRERLELFVPVCQAVQHAHHKGIIHRDLKPSNVLVTVHDTTPLVKVIDFGVAKALGQELTDKTVFTGLAQMIGTPLYMSPEQAGESGLDIDTRSDIYSLGVLLYELLTGTTPFDKERFKQAAYNEIRRIIREEEPPRPSTRLSDSTDSLPSISAQRHMEPAKLTRLVRGELDWIVMKCLEKDRNRRYETATGLAMDVQRYLSDEPIVARPPSATYWLRKFVRRHRGLVVGSMVVLAALVLGIAGTTIGLVQARAERDKVLAAQEKILAAQNKERLALIEAEENFQTARDAVDRMYTRAAEEMRDKPQVEQIRRALLEDALRFYQGFLKRKNEDPAVRFESALSHRRVGEIYGFLGDFKKSLENHRQATTMLIALSPQFSNEVNYRDELARAHFHVGNALLTLLQLEDGTTSMQEAMALWEPLTQEFPGTPSYLEDLARANVMLGRAWTRNYDPRGNAYVSRGHELLAQLKQRFTVHKISSGFQFELRDLAAWRFTALPHETAILKQLEQECRDQLAAAEAESREYPDAPKYQSEVAAWLGRLSNVLTAMGLWEELEQVGKRSLEIRTRLAAQHPQIPEYQTALAWTHYHTATLLHGTDRPDAALDHFRTAIAMASNIVDKNPDNLRAHVHLAGMIRGCPAGQLRDPRRVLELSQRAKELGAASWDDVALAQIDAGQYQEVLATCEKSSLAGQQTGIIAYATAVAYWHLGKQVEARELARQVIQGLAIQPNQHWYTPECHWRTREIAQLMGLEIEELKTSNPEKVLRNGIALYHKLAADRPADPGLQQELARRYSDLSLLLAGGGRNDEAERLLQEAVETFARLAQGKGNVPACRDILARFHHELGVLQQQRGQNEDAEKNLRQAVAVWKNLADDMPEQPAYRVHAANVLTIRLTPLLITTSRAAEAEQTIRSAIADWEKLATEFPGTDEYRRALGESYGVLSNQFVTAQRFPEAEQVCSKALEKWPDTATLFVARSRTYTALAQPEKALADISKAIELAPHDGAAPWWHLERANAFAALQQPEKQLAELSRAIDLWPDLMDARAWRANFHLGRHEWDQAVVDCSKVLELNPNYGPTWHARGLCYGNLGQWDRAAADQTKAIGLGLTGPDVWLARATAHEKLGDLDRALGDYTQLAELHPGHLAIVEVAQRYARLVEMLIQQDRRADAAKLAVALGAAQYRAGHWKESVAAFEKSAELGAPPDSFRSFYLAMAAWQLGDKAKARTAYDEGTAWIEKNKAKLEIDPPRLEKLKRLQAEAGELLGIKK